MRLLFATSYGHLPDVIGGLQTTLHELSLALVHRDVEVHILCGFDGADDASSRFARSDSTLGYMVARLPDPVTALPAVCAACNPDAIVVQTSSPTIPMLLAALDTRIPTLLYIHNVEYRDLGGILLPDPSIRYLANSAFTAERIDATFGFKPHV